MTNLPGSGLSWTFQGLGSTEIAGDYLRVSVVGDLSWGPWPLDRREEGGGWGGGGRKEGGTKGAIRRPRRGQTAVLHLLLRLDPHPPLTDPDQGGVVKGSRSLSTITVFL